MKFILLAILLSSCSIFTPAEEKAARNVAKVIVVVCEETDELVRASFVDKVNKNLEDTPHLYASACNQRVSTTDE